MKKNSFQGKRALDLLAITLVFLIFLITISGAGVKMSGSNEALRKWTRAVEFDFSEWTWDALFNKAVSASLKAERFLSPTEQREVVLQYLEHVARTQRSRYELQLAVSQPGAMEEDESVLAAKTRLDLERATLARIALLAEPVLQNQTELTLWRSGFGTLGQILPPVLFHVSDVPMNLIISPREVIRAEYELSLQAGLDSLERNTIEEGILDEFNKSALVEPVGGLGAYPTMIMRTTDLVWLTDTIAHEWIHNRLTFQPLGMRYFANSEMKTINETTASIAGRELGLALLERYYPEFVPEPQEDFSRTSQSIPEDPFAFNFRKEMRITRLRVDELLAAGKVEKAETYMESRRVFFWENGYQLRKINQAYFAFYGAYNDVPGGGAAGNDPVGPAVQRLREKSVSLIAFIRKIEKVRSFPELQELSR